MAIAKEAPMAIEGIRLDALSHQFGKAIKPTPQIGEPRCLGDPGSNSGKNHAPGSKLLSQQIQIRRGKHRWFHIRHPPSHPPQASVPHACRKDTNKLGKATWSIGTDLGCCQNGRRDPPLFRLSHQIDPFQRNSGSNHGGCGSWSCPARSPEPGRLASARKPPLKALLRAGA